jgi:hypothetical protein
VYPTSNGNWLDILSLRCIHGFRLVNRICTACVELLLTCQISMYFLEVGTECSIATNMNFGQHPGKGRINNPPPPVSPSICDIKSPPEVDNQLTAAELTAHNNGQGMACWVQLKFTIINKTKLIKIINSTVMEISIIKIFTYGPELGWSRRRVSVSNVTVGYLRMLQTVGVSRQQRNTESRGTFSLHPPSLHRR